MQFKNGLRKVFSFHLQFYSTRFSFLLNEYLCQTIKCFNMKCLFVGIYWTFFILKSIISISYTQK